MTLEELDQMLELVGLDFSNPECVKIKDMIHELHGKSIIDAKKERCERCWCRENGKCFPQCDLLGIDSDPIQASKQYISRPNDIKVFPFYCMFVVPVYEKITGKTDTMDLLRKEYRRLMKMKMKRAEKKGN